MVMFSAIPKQTRLAIVVQDSTTAWKSMILLWRSLYCTMRNYLTKPASQKVRNSQQLPIFHHKIITSDQELLASNDDFVDERSNLVVPRFSCEHRILSQDIEHVIIDLVGCGHFLNLLFLVLGL